MSFSAHGALGEVLVFFERHGKSYVRSKPQDPVSLSLAQGLLRDCFASAAVSAHSLTQGQKDYYASLAPNSAFCPWWNNFIGQYIKDNYEAPGVATTFIKSVQIATGTILDGQSSVDILIDSIDNLKAIPFILGRGAVNSDPRNSQYYVSFLDATHLRAVRHWTPMTGDLVVSLMVWEFEPDFLVSKEDITFVFDVDDTLVEKSIDPVTLAKTILFPRGNTSHADVAANLFNWYADMPDNTTVRIRRPASGSKGYYIFSVCEFI